MIGVRLDARRHVEDMDRRLEDGFKARGENGKIDLLMTLPGMTRIAAMIILAELGGLSRLKSAKELSSWAGLRPDDSESAGTPEVARTRKGNKLKRIIYEAALAATKSEGCFKRRFKSLKRGMSSAKAVFDASGKMLGSIYQMLTKSEPCEEHSRDCERLAT